MKLAKSKNLFHPSNKNNKKISEFDIINTTFSGDFFHDKSRNTKNPSREKELNIFSQNVSNDKSFNNWDNLTIQKIKKKRNRDKSRNSKLTPAKYIKPLFYMLNDRITAINKQFSGFKNQKYFIISNKNQSSKNDNNFEYDIYIKNLRKNNKNKRKKNQNRSFDDKFKNSGSKSYITYSQDDINNLNFKVNVLQAYFRSFICRYKFYKNLRDKIGSGNYSEKINKKVNNYFNKLNSIKKGNTNLKSINKEDNSQFFNILINSSYKTSKAFIEYKSDNFSIKSKKNKSSKRTSINNNNIYLIKKQNENFEKEREIFLKEKKANELKIKELTEENNKLKNNYIFYEKNKINFEKLKEDNEILKQRISQLEQRNRDCEMMEIKYSNLVAQNEALYKDNLSLNEQIESRINKLVEMNKKNQEKIKLYEELLLGQESLSNENNKLNKINKEMENKMAKLIKENNDYKQKLNEKEAIIKNNIYKRPSYLKNINPKNTNLKQENEELISENKKIQAKNEELQNLVEEMKKKISRISNAHKFMNISLSDNSSREKTKINTPNELNEESNKKNEEDSEEVLNNNHELYLQRVRNRSFSGIDKTKEEKLKKLFKNRILEMKDYLHRCFMRFYYNGIFVQLQKRKTMEAPVTKVVKSKRFSSLVDKFNSGSSNLIGKADIRNLKRGKTQKYDDKLGNFNKILKTENIIYEDKEE